MKKQRKKVNRVIDNGPNPAPDLPTEFKNAIAEEFRGTNIVLVILKRIFASEVRPGQNRFLVPVRQVRTEFLTEEEKRKLNNQDLSVVLIQPCLELIKMNMKTGLWPRRMGKPAVRIVEDTVGVRGAGKGKQEEEEQSIAGGNDDMASSSSSQSQEEKALGRSMSELSSENCDSESECSSDSSSGSICTRMEKAMKLKKTQEAKLMNSAISSANANSKNLDCAK
ncbi:B3 domain-containing protein At2g31720-like [Dillenia turbinata]|uniref:B3 domain-containing protein At2g31720-like n=1 Tax=Dillenia turbinata TaxID=194707 RepID=A0AAN8VMW0_9MAGN